MNTTTNVYIGEKLQPQYDHCGQKWLRAKFGETYELVIANHYNHDLIAVVEVDGLNVIEGRARHDDSPGYIVRARDICVIKGWRVSHEEIRRFVFTRKEKSYAANKKGGAESNCGIISVRLYNINDGEVVKEYPKLRRNFPSVPEWPKMPEWPSIPSPMTPPKPLLPWPDPTWNSPVTCKFDGVTPYVRGVSATVSSFDAGTGFSKIVKRDVVETRDVLRGDFVSEHIICYTSLKGLKSMGVDMKSLGARAAYHSARCLNKS